jgi:polyhydroxybutyrate depolymerase
VAPAPNPVSTSRGWIAMKKALRFFLSGLVAVVALCGALFGYFIYSPAPEVPRLSGRLTQGTLEAGGWKRTYLTYVPGGWKSGAPLVVVMHGSGENGARIRKETGYAFDRLADEQGFAVVYPDAYKGYWNACNVVGDYSANRLNIDDVGFLTGIVDKLIIDIGVDRGRVFATGVSRGGHMAYRLALEAPSRFRAVAAVAASVPVPENFKCKPAGQGTSSVIIMNGTKDPINPFGGGEVKLFGFLKRGKVRSARDSGRYLAELNHIPGPPATRDTPGTGEDHVEQMLWRNGSNVEVELIAIHGAGHGLPQPYTRYPRLLGPTPKEPNGPAVIWAFFERQKPG